VFVRSFPEREHGLRSNLEIMMFLLRNNLFKFRIGKKNLMGNSDSEDRATTVLKKTNHQN